MKLKLRKVNENKTSLTEADVDLGYRLKKIENINQIVSAAVTAADYKYKNIKSNGFYIIPKSGYVSKLSIKGENAGETDTSYTFTLTDAHDKPININGKNGAKLDFDAMSELLPDIGAEMAKALICPAVFDATSESLSENVLLEYGPFSGVKNFFAKKAADKSDANLLKRQLSEFEANLTKGLNEAVASLLSGGKQYVNVVSENKNDSLVITLTSSFLIGLTFDSDPKNIRNVIVSKLLTHLGEVKLKSRDVSNVLKQIGKILDINFKLSGDINKDDSNPAQPQTNPTPTNEWEELIGVDAFAELTEVSEAANTEMLTEAYKMKIPAVNYKKALDKVANNDAAFALIRYFLLNETAGKLSEETVKALDLKIIDDILDIIKKAGTFNPNTSFELLYIMQYALNHSDITQSAVEFAKKLPKACKNAAILEKPTSIIYQKVFFDTSNDIDTLLKIASSWYGSRAFQEESLASLTAENRETLIDNFELNQSFVSKNKNDTEGMRKELLYNESTKKFRSLDEIHRIEQEILAMRTKTPKADAEDAGEEVAVDINEPYSDETEDKIDGFIANIDDLNDQSFKDLLKIASERQISDAAHRSQIAKAILTAMGRSV